jgi:hypothetical protein
MRCPADDPINRDKTTHHSISAIGAIFLYSPQANDGVESLGPSGSEQLSPKSFCRGHSNQALLPAHSISTTDQSVRAAIAAASKTGRASVRGHGRGHNRLVIRACAHRPEQYFSVHDSNPEALFFYAFHSGRIRLGHELAFGIKVSIETAVR